MILGAVHTCNVQNDSGICGRGNVPKRRLATPHTKLTGSWECKIEFTYSLTSIMSNVLVYIPLKDQKNSLEKAKMLH